MKPFKDVILLSLEKIKYDIPISEDKYRSLRDHIISITIPEVDPILMELNGYMKGLGIDTRNRILIHRIIMKDAYDEYFRHCEEQGLKVDKDLQILYGLIFSSPPPPPPPPNNDP